MCADLFSSLYGLQLDRGLKRSAAIETYLAIQVPRLITLDDHRNEPDTYEKLFSPECRWYVEKMYSVMMGKLKIYSYQECGESLEALAVLQEIISIALWKYRKDVGDQLERFAREFDRLDVREERRRLYESGQA